jgi:hypothetical protein
MITRVGSTSPWGMTVTINPSGNQIFPQLYTDGTDVTITWEDDRFLYSTSYAGYAHNTGWGIFGMKLDALDGSLSSNNWLANTAGLGAADQNGIAIILSNFMLAFSTVNQKYRIANYNNSGDFILLWEDMRSTTPGNGSDVVYVDDTFLP